MGFVSKLLGRKRELTEEDLKIKSHEFFSNAERLLVINDYKGAMKYIKENYSEIENAIKPGASSHFHFVDIVLKVKSFSVKTTAGVVFAGNHYSLPNYKVFTDASDAVLSDFLNTIKEVKEELIYLKFTDDKSYLESDILNDIEGICEFKIDQRVVIVFTGPDPRNCIIRKDYLLNLGKNIDKKSTISEIAQKFPNSLINSETEYITSENDSTFGYKLPKIIKKH